MGIHRAKNRSKESILRGNIKEPRGIQRGNLEEPRRYSQGQYRGAKGVFTGAI